MIIINYFVKMPESTSPNSNFATEQLCFPSVAGYTVRAEFTGGEISSDFGAVLLSAIDQRIGLLTPIAKAIKDYRHQSYVTHSMLDLLKQRVFQVASGYEDGNDANTLRRDPLFKMAIGRSPLDSDNNLASGSTHCRLENSLTTRDVYRISQAMMEQFIAGYSEPPKSIILDMDHTEDATHGQQELSFYNGYYDSHCYLPLLVFEGTTGALVAAVLRPGKRPTGAENAMIMKRILKKLRKHWPQTNILLRGDGHFSNPELMELVFADGNANFIFGLGGNPVLLKQAEDLMHQTRNKLAQQQELAKSKNEHPVESARVFGEFEYAAKTWPKVCRVVVKAEVLAPNGNMPPKDNARFIVTNLTNHTPQELYEKEYCARGQAENLIKQIKNDLKSDRTSAHSFVANCGRLLFAAMAYILHQQLRILGLHDTTLATAQPKTVILNLFKITTRIKQYKDRVLLQLPNACPVKELLAHLCQTLCPPTRRHKKLASP